MNGKEEELKEPRPPHAEEIGARFALWFGL